MSSSLGGLAVWVLPRLAAGGTGVLVGCGVDVGRGVDVGDGCGVDVGRGVDVGVGVFVTAGVDVGCWLGVLVGVTTEAANSYGPTSTTLPLFLPSWSVAGAPMAYPMFITGLFASG